MKTISPDVRSAAIQSQLEKNYAGSVNIRQSSTFLMKRNAETIVAK